MGETLFTPQLADMVTGLYGVRPEIRFVEIAALVDNGLPSSPSLTPASVLA